MAKRIAILLLFVFLICPGPARADEALIVLAGAAGKPVLEEASRQFETTHQIKITLVFGGSGKLLSDVVLSGKGDVYIPASADYMDKAREKGLIAPGSVKIFAYLIPALCVPASNPLHLETLSDLASNSCRIGLGRPDTVTVGGFSLEILQKSGLISSIRPKIATYFDDYSRLMMGLNIGSIDVAIGWYLSEYSFGKDLKTIPLAPSEVIRISTYEGAVLTTSTQPKLAQEFLDFLSSLQGKENFKKFHYLTEKEEAEKLAPGAQLNGSPVFDAQF